jgi:hypothetical protein
MGRIDVVTTPNDCPIVELFVEIERYLHAVEVFRSEGSEPQWLAEPLPGIGCEGRILPA